MSGSLSYADLSPVGARMTLADSVYASLREALAMGRFDPGQTLTIAALAETFQTSHMPVRDALRRLGVEGALEMRPNGSARVPLATREALDDTYRARVVLECLAVELAVEHMTDGELAALVEIEAQHAERSRARSVYEMLEKNRDFHFHIYRTARSPVVLSLIDSLWLRYGPFMRQLSEHMSPKLETGQHDRFMQGHREIVAAIAARDAPRAARALRDDITSTRDLLHQFCP